MDIRLLAVLAICAGVALSVRHKPVRCKIGVAVAGTGGGMIGAGLYFGSGIGVWLCSLGAMVMLYGGYLVQSR